MLPAGNYEWPFEFTLPGNTAESVEGIPEASITYKLKATVARGKLAYDLHAYKALRIIRTLEPAALEFLHAMSVENIWPNKVDYSIVIPQKAVVFGASVPLQMRFTPLLKGLEMGEISVKMLEIRECTLQGPTGNIFKEHRTEREVSNWKFEVDREEHWHDTIEDTGQEGWMVEKKLNLPKRLRQCVQDLNHNGIKVRHKLKLVVALKNPDGHISEVCCCHLQPRCRQKLTNASCEPLSPFPSSSPPICPSMSMESSSTRTPAQHQPQPKPQSPESLLLVTENTFSISCTKTST